MVIVDKVQRCRNRKTKNARLLEWTAASDSYVLMLFATAFESRDKVGPLVSALGLCEPGYMGEWRWMSAHGCFAGSPRYGRRLVFHGGREHLEKMHHKIFPSCSMQLRIKNIRGFLNIRTSWTRERPANASVGG